MNYFEERLQEIRSCSCQLCQTIPEHLLMEFIEEELEDKQDRNTKYQEGW